MDEKLELDEIVTEEDGKFQIMNKDEINMAGISLRTIVGLTKN